jgi:hypothetical protein
VSDTVNHPKHYTFGKLEVIDVIEDWRLNFNTGNAVKYIARAPHKGKHLEDLKKALWYLCREIETVERDKSNG